MTNAAWLLAAGALVCGTSFAAEPPREIVVVSDINYPPYLFQGEGGALQGILKDKWDLWSQRTGVAARVEGMEWIQAQQSVQNGTADVIEALAYTEARARLYEYSPPYAPVDARVFFHRSITGINDAASMRGFTIGAKEGSACGAWLAARGAAMIRAYPDSELLVKAAGARELRLFCMDAPAAHYYLFKHGLADDFRETPPLYSTQFHWAVKKGRAELRDFIQAGFGRISEKEMNDIDARWLGAPLRYQLSERQLLYLALAGAAVLAILLLGLVWNRQLQSRVDARTAELRRALGSLGDSERRISKLIEASPELIAVVDVADGRFIQVNPACEKVLGYPGAEMIGRTGAELGLWLNLDERARHFDEIGRAGAVHGREIRVRRKDGGVRDILSSAAVFELDQRKYILFQAVDITEQKAAQQALSEHQSLLRELAAHHDSVREGERAHIAREVHDELGQSLTALKMELSVVGMTLGEAEPRIREPVQDLKARVDAIIQVVRNVATSLRPAALDLGFLSGVEWLVGEFRRRSDIGCTVSVSEGGVMLGEERSIVLFRILQESLTNISRHANAHNVEISLRQDGGRVRLEVRDDGDGFDVESARSRKTFGLLGMKERAIMLKGEMSIASAPGRGTLVSVSMPVTG